jgi:hypothetical protein
MSSSRPEFNYPVSLAIEYATDQEYRNCVRKLVSMDTDVYFNPETETTEPKHTMRDIDDITEDEWTFDQDTTTAFLDDVYSRTICVPALANLYELSAAVMFSTDPNIGMTILFSYDHLNVFHLCLCKFFSMAEPANSAMESNEHLAELLARFSTNRRR